MKNKLLAILAISLFTMATSAAQCFAAGPLSGALAIGASAQWGAYVSDGTLAQFESLVGKTANIQAVFVGWGSDGDFPAEYKATIAAKGKTLMIFWEPSVNYDSITSGKWNSYLTSFAAAAKNYGGPVILAPFHEMNGDWDIWGGTVGTNTPQKMINAWRYVHNYFTGAANVKFGLAVNNDSVPDTKTNAITAYYPGDAYVDYVGIDGFNFNDPWQNWQSVFSSALTTVKQYNKPIYIFSTASCQGPQKAQWIADMAAGVKQYNLAGWIWFNENKECNWLVNSDTSSLAAFKAMVGQTTTVTVAPATVVAVPKATSSPTVAAVSGATIVATAATQTDTSNGSGARKRSNHRDS